MRSCLSGETCTVCTSKWLIIRRLRKRQTLMPVRLSVCSHVSGTSPTNRYAWNCIFGISVSVCHHVPISVTVCHHVPISVTVCHHVPISVTVCHHVPISVTVCQHVPMLIKNVTKRTRHFAYVCNHSPLFIFVSEADGAACVIAARPKK